MSPVRPQLGPPPDQAGAPDDQPPPAVDGFGDLRLAVVGVVDALSGVLVDLLDGGADVLVIRTAIEYCQPAFSRRLNTRVFQNPESALSSLAPVAPARSTRAMSSSTKRSMPFWVFADPFLRRMCSTSRVSARVARRGVAERGGVAVGGALVQPAADLSDEAVDVDDEPLGAGTGAGLSGALKRPAEQRVELADMPEGKRAQKRPERRGRRDPATQQPPRAPGAQQAAVVDAVGP